MVRFEQIRACARLADNAGPIARSSNPSKTKAKTTTKTV
jgi:hypothetical protein